MRRSTPPRLTLDRVSWRQRANGSAGSIRLSLRAPSAVIWPALIMTGAKAPAEALAWFSRARALRPSHVEAARHMAAVLQALGRFPEALKAYDDALRLGLVDPAAFYNRGLVLRALGRRDEAIASFDQALKLKPAYPEAVRAGAILLSEAGQLEAALEFVEEALRIKPDFFEAHLDRANLLHRLGALEAALNAYSEALDLFPGHADLCNNRGVILQELGELEAARSPHSMWRSAPSPTSHRRCSIAARPS